MTKSYSEMSLLPTLKERYEYLKLDGHIGFDTFGYDRYLNQGFYRSAEWKRVRNYVIARDNGCELGIQDRPIGGRIYVHHIIPLTKEDIMEGTDKMLNPDNLVCVSFEMHNAIHYGVDADIITANDLIIRTENDTCPWKNNGGK